MGHRVRPPISTKSLIGGSEVILACMGVWDDGLGKAARKLFKPGL